MKKFGIIGEGITDQITIENILCGFFKNKNLDIDIEPLRPRRIKGNKQNGDGGWLSTFKYLETEDFRNDLVNTEFIIIQIDTDASEEKHFDIPKIENNKELSPNELIEKVINKCILIINSGDNGFYENHAKQFIFAISVHQLECWIYAHYSNQPRIKNCFKALNRHSFDEKIPRCSKEKGCCLDKTGSLKNPDKEVIQKNYDCYNKLSQPFSERKNVDLVAQKDPSFRFFIQQLPIALSLGVENL